MKLLRGMITGVAMLSVLPAQAATSDPEIVIYRFPGVMDDGGASEAGVATAFLCTNFSGVLEGIRIVIRDNAGAIRVNFNQSINHLQTLTLTTHATVLYIDFALATGALTQGTAAIAATSVNIVCTAVTLDAASNVPNGFALRGIRFNPAPGSQE
jgi:hypothetical protein